MIAVTVGPGLEPALWAGITFAKTLKKEYFKKANFIFKIFFITQSFVC